MLETVDPVFAIVRDRYRSLRLAAAVVVMMVIGIYQYSWFLFLASHPRVLSAPVPPARPS